MTCTVVQPTAGSFKTGKQLITAVSSSPHPRTSTGKLLRSKRSKNAQCIRAQCFLFCRHCCFETDTGIAGLNILEYSTHMLHVTVHFVLHITSHVYTYPGCGFFEKKEYYISLSHRHDDRLQLSPGCKCGAFSN